LVLQSLLSTTCQRRHHHQGGPRRPPHHPVAAGKSPATVTSLPAITGRSAPPVDCVRDHCHQARIRHRFRLQQDPSNGANVAGRGT